MKKLIFTAWLAMLSIASTAQGIQFEKGLNWQQILEKARIENKYIFVDFMATWCVPCKQMDDDVYPDANLGKYVNQKFLSVKVQGDKTPKDDAFIRSWYEDATVLAKKYEVTSFPTYLFFDPNGNIVHRGSGLKSVGKFSILLEQVFDANAQYYGKYYKLKTDYSNGIKSYSETPYFVSTARNFGEDALAKKVAKDYIHNFLLKLDDKKLYTLANLDFIAAFLDSKDKTFKMFYPASKKVDSLQVGLSDKYVTEVIIKEEVNPIIVKDNDYKQPMTKKPNWIEIEKKIRKKYNQELTYRSVLKAKMSWYRYSEKNWEELAKALIPYLDKYGDYTSLGGADVNNKLFEFVFKNVDDKSLLEAAAKVQKKLIDLESNDPDHLNIDTYANLLYKSGKVQEAIQWQEKAREINKAIIEKKGKGKLNQEILSNLEKMKKGEPTWPIKN